MFECYNLLDPMEWAAVFFEVDVERGNFKILQILLNIVIFFSGREIDSSN
jgi:hypothetical protein